MNRLRAVVVAALLSVISACASPPAILPLAAMQAPEGEFVVVTIRNDRGRVASHAASTARGYDAAGAYAASPRAAHTAARLARDYGLTEVAAWPIQVLGVHCVVFRATAGDAPTAIAKLASDERVESAQPLTSFTTQATASNDPYRPLQKNLDVLGVDRAHRWSRGAGVRLALIDTGVDVAHADLASEHIVARNFVDADPVRFRADLHGTEVAGVIAARVDNARGIVGVAPDVTLYAFKACWYEANATRARCNTFTLARALAAAIDANVQAINLSLSGPRDPLLQRLLEQALARRMVNVAAMPPHPARDAFPAELPEVLGVAASEGGPYDANVILAPGQDVPTLAPNDAYDFASGSSIAAAEVSGVVALLLARHPRLEPRQIRDILASSGGGTISANASINACRALAILDSNDCATTTALATAAEHER